MVGQARHSSAPPSPHHTSTAALAHNMDHVLLPLEQLENSRNVLEIKMIFREDAENHKFAE